MTTIHGSAMPKLIAFAVAGKPGEARIHVSHMIPRGADLAPLRKQVAEACTPEFRDLVLAALPWLAADRFDTRDSDLGERLREAGADGLPRSTADRNELAALGDDVVEFAEPTGGRPRAMIRLREFDNRHNPFAS